MVPVGLGTFATRWSLRLTGLVAAACVLVAAAHCRFLSAGAAGGAAAATGRPGY